MDAAPYAPDAATAPVRRWIGWVLPQTLRARTLWLVLLLVACLAAMLLLTAQAMRLAVVEGAERLAAAEARLDTRSFLPTYRGRIVDRHGRILAIDRACYDVAVPYTVITGQWSLVSSEAETIFAFG